MNNSHYVKIEFEKEGNAVVKIKATRGEIVKAISYLVGDCIEQDLLPDTPDHITPVGVKIGAAIATGINATTLSLCSTEKVYNDLIYALTAQFTIINKTMKGEN